VTIDHREPGRAVLRSPVRQLGVPSAPEAKVGRIALPLIGREAAPEVLVTNDDIADAFDAEDVERYRAR